MYGDGESIAADAGTGGRPEIGGLPSLDERKKRLRDADVYPAMPAVAPNEETAKTYQEALRAYYEYRKHGYSHRQRLFEWQLRSSVIIFLVVLALVGCGIYFAARQFHHGLRQRDVATKNAVGDDVTQITLSFKELKVSSSVLGVIVLTLSLAFFYLYLVFVYPIENVF
jgi:hypothetical protein